jgi:hypothetical protein
VFDGKYERNGKKETTNFKDWLKQWLAQKGKPRHDNVFSFTYFHTL